MEVGPVPILRSAIEGVSSKRSVSEVQYRILCSTENENGPS